MSISNVEYWGRRAEIAEDALKEISELTDVNSDEAPGIARRALAKMDTVNIAYWRKRV